MDRVLLLSRIRPNLRLSLALLLALALLASSFAATPAAAQISQDTEQEGESGEADLAGEALQSGDNSNQCVGEQEVINTGNAQNAIDVLFWTPARDQYGPRHFFFFDDFEVEDVGADITVSPTNTTDCTQRVNQAASAASAVSPWYWDGYQWLYWTGDTWAPTYWDATLGWVYWDGYNWVPTWSLVSTVATGTLDAARGTLPLVTLGALALIGTTSLLIRRNRGRDD